MMLQPGQQSLPSRAIALHLRPNTMSPPRGSHAVLSTSYLSWWRRRVDVQLHTACEKSKNRTSTQRMQGTPRCREHNMTWSTCTQSMRRACLRSCTVHYIQSVAVSLARLFPPQAASIYALKYAIVDAAVEPFYVASPGHGDEGSNYFGVRTIA